MNVTSSMSLDYGRVYVPSLSFVGTNSPAENICKVLKKCFCIYDFVLLGGVTIPQYKLLNCYIYPFRSTGSCEGYNYDWNIYIGRFNHKQCSNFTNLHCL